MGPARQFRTPANDWVLLVLEKCLGVRHGYLLPYDAALNDDIPNRGGFTAVGYSAGRQMVDSNCSIRLGSGSGAGATMLNDCPALPGDSGAPIIMRGTNRVVGMISGFHAGSSLSCGSSKDIVHEPWNLQCTNGAIPFSVLSSNKLTEQLGIFTPKLAVRLGYDVGPYGVIDQPLLARAIEQVQSDMGMVPTVN